MSVRPELAQDLAGTVLEGAYRLVRRVGHGGMGAVYEATQLRLQKRVAVKIMSRESISDMVSLERFKREAEITSKLGHPHLVSVIDFGAADTGQPYMVMEYLEGEDLDHLLQRSVRLPMETVVRIVRQAASALGAAHAQEVVHRDLKPANIFLLQVPGEPEFVKVLDFGISKVKTAGGRRLTAVQSVVGTPVYMSPEQVLGRTDDIDHRADQWALACIAWEMLCGRPPFLADETDALFFQIVRIDPPPLGKEASDIPPAVEAVLRRALSKRHTDRFPSIRDFARAFEQAAVGRETEATPTPLTFPEMGQSKAAGLASSSALRALPREAGLVVSNEILGRVTPLTERLPRYKQPAWRLAITVAAAGVLAVVGTFVVQSLKAAPTAVSSPTPTAPRPSRVEPLPPAPVPPEPEAAPKAQATPEAVIAPKHRDGPSRLKGSQRDKPRAFKAKTEAPSTPAKHRLFQEL